MTVYVCYFGCDSSVIKPEVAKKESTELTKLRPADGNGLQICRISFSQASVLKPTDLARAWGSVPVPAVKSIFTLGAVDPYNFRRALRRPQVRPVLSEFAELHGLESLESTDS